MGALARALIFGAVGAYGGTLVADQGDHPANEAAPAVLAVVCAIPGAGLGAIVGMFIRGDERWEPVQADRIHLAPE